MQCYLCGTELNDKQAVQYVIISVKDKYEYVCARCRSLMDTCYMCEHSSKCAFNEDTSGIPKQTARRVRQGNIAIQTVEYNPELVKKTCAQCTCYDPVDGVDGAWACNKEYKTCGKFDCCIEKLK